MNKTTAELAEIVGGQLYGDPTHIISELREIHMLLLRKEFIWST